MVFYTMNFKYELKQVDIIMEEEGIKDEKDILFISPKCDRNWRDSMASLNDGFGTKCALDGRLSFLAVDGKPYSCLKGELIFAVAADFAKITIEECIECIEKRIKSEIPGLKTIEFVSKEEVGSKRLNELTENARRSGFCSKMCWYNGDANVDFFSNYLFAAQEYMCEVGTSREAVDAKAAAIMADKTLRDEIDRIYSDENMKEYRGNPVHYKLTVGNAEAALDIVQVLVAALKDNNRLLGTRITHIYNLDEGCSGEEELEKAFEVASGCCVIVEMSGTDENHGRYASAYERVIRYIEKITKKNALYTLIFFVDNTEHPGFSRRLISGVSENLDLVEIKEGIGKYSEAVNFMSELATKAGIEVCEEDLKKTLKKEKSYTVSEIYSSYKKLCGNLLKEHTYKAYRQCKVVKIEKEEQPKVAAYKELQAMIGLTEVKGIVDRIIASGKMREMRAKMGLDTYKSSMHMIFTGNPGSAKTTVARLLAQILKQEGILSSGAFVEVGRQDLVGKYVGWTAPTVSRKFREASGGVLFIDEAYSLVEDHASYGDEAINTIVQEMENHREDVIVIFAGYPERMKEFLDKNEGLRSRIAFHVDFPDYNAEELWGIMQLMAKKHGVKLDKSVREKCIETFKVACTHEEFGNGRFVRNMFEQATMNQAQRIFDAYKGKKVPKEVLGKMVAADFDTNVGEHFKEKKSVGFIA